MQPLHGVGRDPKLLSHLTEKQEKKLLIMGTIAVFYENVCNKKSRMKNIFLLFEINGCRKKILSANVCKRYFIKKPEIVSKKQI